MKLTAREMRFLSLIYPEGTISVGLTVGYRLQEKGYVREAKEGRLGLTRKGLIAVAANLNKRSQ